MANGTLKVGTITTSSGSGNITIGSGVTVNVNRPAFHAGLSSNQSIPNTTTTVIINDVEILDTDSSYDISTGVFTVPSGQAGKYYFYSLVRRNNFEHRSIMTSILKVDTIQDADGNNIINESGNTITIGASGDTTNIVGTLQNDGAAVGGTNTPSFHVTQSASQNFATATTTKITYDTELYDVGGGFNTSNNNFTVPSGEAGKYFFYMQTQGIFADANGEFCKMNLFINDTETKNTRICRGVVTTDSAFFHTVVVDLSVGDVVDARLYHTQGSTRGNDNNAKVTYFLGYKLIG
jgi:hypothetical protein